MWVSLNPQETSVEQVFEPLATRSRDYDRPWSVAELRLTDGDIQWLQAWFSSLKPEVTLCAGGFGPFSLPAEMFGALLIILGSEVCRRTGREHAVWPAMRSVLPRDHPFRKELFISNGQPSHVTRNAITQAACALNLRNAMDIEGTQQWYVTIKLQFGFTYRGAKLRLAEWLAGYNPPHAVQYLNGEAGFDKLISYTFQDMWRALRQYRRKLIDTDQARSVLEKSPWVKPDWIDDLLVEACSKIEIPDGWYGDRPLEHRDEELDYEENRSLVKRVFLEWELEGPPHICLELDQEAIVQELGDIDATDLDFFVDGRRTCRWIRQSDGTWRGKTAIYAEPDLGGIPPNLSPKTLTICTGEGNPLETWDLAGLGLEQDVLVFDLRRDKLLKTGFERLNPNDEYAIICDRDCQVSGCNPVDTYEPPQGDNRKVLRLPTPLAEAISVSIKDFILWQPLRPQDPERLTCSVALHAENDRVVELDERIRLHIEGVPEQANEVGLLIGRRKFETERETAGWITTRAATISPEFAAKQRTTRVRFVCDGKPQTVKPSLELKVQGAAFIVGDPKHAGRPFHLEKLKLSSDTILNRGAGGGQLRLWVPEESRNLWVYEGDYLVGRLRHGRVGLRDFPGLGGTLRVQGQSTYDFGIPCIDSGWVSGFLPRMLGRPAQVELTRKKQPDLENHRIVIWRADNRGRAELESLPRKALLDCRKPGIWRIDCPSDILAIAVTWKGAWLGAWWNINGIMKCQFRPSVQIFAAIRWLRLPVLSSDLEQVVRQAAQKAPHKFLAAWVGNEGLPEFVRPLDSEPGHDTVIRHYLGNWLPPSPDHRNEAVRCLTGSIDHRTPELWSTALIRLGEYSLPLLWWSMLKCERIPSRAGQVYDLALARLLGLQEGCSRHLCSARLASDRALLADRAGVSVERIDQLIDIRTVTLKNPASRLRGEDECCLRALLERLVGRRLFTARLIQSRAEELGR